MKIVKQTDTGLKREQNEDQLGVFYNTADQVLLLLCDGMGGQNAGDVASQMALTEVGERWRSTEEMASEEATTWLTQTLELTNQRILEKSNQFDDLLGMGTTIVALADFGAEVVVAHVGDSRAYHLRQGSLAQVTKDHSYVQELVDQEIISPEEAKHHPQKNIITQSMGINPSINVDLIQISVEVGDIFLLCSDGLTDMIEDQDILAVLLAKPNIEEAVKQLIWEANNAGGRDNISIILAQVQEGE